VKKWKQVDKLEQITAIKKADHGNDQLFKD